MIGYLIIILLHLNIDHLNQSNAVVSNGNNNFYLSFSIKMALLAISESTVCKNTSASQFWINSVISCLELLLKEY